MKTTNNYLDDLKAKHGVRSDYALAKKLGVMPGHITTYRKNRSHFDDKMAVRVAELLEIDPAEVLAAMNVERTKCPAAKAVWERVARSFSAGVMAVFIAVALNLAPAPAQAGMVKNSPIIHIMLNCWRGWRWLFYRQSAIFLRFFAFSIFSPRFGVFSPSAQKITHHRHSFIVWR